MLILGGTGSFGNAFVEKLLKEGKHDRIAIYSRCELKQFEMRERFNNDSRLRFLIGCVRDKERLKLAMEGVSTVVVAAALKRLEVAEYAPLEVMQTNIIGAANAIEAAHHADVKKVVYLSTDKAASAINAYGASKLFAEKIMLAANHMFGEGGAKHSVCRYGNIWKSRGSIVPKWEEILKTSDTVPVTSPDCTRYFMTLDQATDLVLETINTMKGGEINIPDLPGYRIGDLAEAFGAKMNITGLPPAEKEAETMDGITDSSQARRMTVEELQNAIKSVY